MIRLLVIALSLAFASLSVSAKPEDTAQPIKRIALSFDDVPRREGAYFTSDERTLLIIEGLRKARVEQAAFFLNPGLIAKRPGAEKRIAAYVAAGHVIANHTNTHPGLSNTSVEDFLADLDAAAEWLEGRDGLRPWFRFPFLDEGRRDAQKRDALRVALAERGLINAYATVDASDWFYENAVAEAERANAQINLAALRELYIEVHVDAAEAYDAIAREAIGRSPAHVMLLHETDLAALFIGDLVRALETKGWTIITNDEAYDDPFARYAATYDTPSAQGTLTEQVAWQMGVSAPRWYEGNNTRIASEWFRTRVLRDTKDTDK
ncbi:polysaccharide deacetylase family protein [uncultured Erythrobacter sp.]|uniref:polysaccharide deacetylase family protein n=1 Tax=uncultured Erythrobacter sp. TaxID=263913 RepID=UPI0026181FBD|nr:polysaccharide deacetylase family protein [uncultured Erythrobacter sp.]